MFNSDPIAYLRGVPDREPGKESKQGDRDLQKFLEDGKPKLLRKETKHDFEVDWSSYYRWTFEWSAEEISDVISAYGGQPVGKVLAINVLERGPSGRALLIEYVTDVGTFTDTKDRIRASLRYINASGARVNLPSTLFYIEPVVDKQSGEVAGFVARGGGFGHGVGMSQTGAVGMAERGHTYSEILAHYYQGIALEEYKYPQTVAN